MPQTRALSDQELPHTWRVRRLGPPPDGETAASVTQFRWTARALRLLFATVKWGPNPTRVIYNDHDGFSIFHGKVSQRVDH